MRQTNEIMIVNTAGTDVRNCFVFRKTDLRKWLNLISPSFKTHKKLLLCVLFKMRIYWGLINYYTKAWNYKWLYHIIWADCITCWLMINATWLFRLFCMDCPNNIYSNTLLFCWKHRICTIQMFATCWNVNFMYGHGYSGQIVDQFGLMF